MKLLKTILFISFLGVTIANAQIENYLGQINQKDIDLYAKPLATSLGTVMNSGAYHSANISNLFGFSVGVKAFLVMIPDDQKTFKPASLDPAKGYDNSKPTPTIFGEQYGTAYAGQDGFIGYPGGFNINLLSVAVPQITVSTMNTELLLRYFGGFKIGEKDFSMLGVGLRHQIDQYFPMLPVALSINGLYSTLNISDIAKANSFAIGLAASKSFGVLIPYAGLLYESSTVKFDYNYNDGTTTKKIETEVKGDNTFRFTLGGALKLGFFVFNVDFNVGSQNTAVAGFTFEF